MAQPAMPLTAGSVIHRVDQQTEEPKSEPPDPYHLPFSALTPPRRVTEEWRLVGADGREQAAYFVTRDAQGGVVQVAHRDSASKLEQTWWPASNQVLRDPLPSAMPIIDGNVVSRNAMQASGYREIGSAMIAGQSGRIFERRSIAADGTAVVHSVSIGDDPYGVILGERSIIVDANGVSRVLSELSTQLWEVLPASRAPAELRSWSPPSGATVVNHTDLKPRHRRSSVSRVDELVKKAPFRIPRAPSTWAVGAVFYAGPSVEEGSGLNAGLFPDAVPSGAAASILYRLAGSDRVAEVIVGPRNALLERLRRTPASWQTAEAVPLEVMGRQATVWLATSQQAQGPHTPPSPSAAPPPGAASTTTVDVASRPAATTTLTALVDLGDIFVVTRFQSFDRASALDFLRQLSPPLQR